MKDWELRSEVREEGRRGVVGREGGLLRVADVERFTVGGGAAAGVAMAAMGLGRYEAGWCRAVMVNCIFPMEHSRR